MRQLFAGSAAAICALVGGVAQAGVVITAESNSVGGTRHPVSFLLEPDRLHEVTGGKEMIYRGDLGKFWTLNVRDHSYEEVNRETIRQTRAQWDASMDKLRQQIPSLPEAQRKQAEEMLAQQKAPPPQEVKYELSGNARKIGTWTCTPYRVRVNGAQREELCVVRMDEVGLARDDVKAFASLSAFVQEVTPGGSGTSRTSAFSFDEMAKAIGYDAFPVESTNYGKDGKIVSRTIVKTIEHKSLAADSFEVPQDFKKKDNLH